MHRFALRSAASLLLLASAALFVTAAAQRWWPACRRGLFDTDACLRLQDHRFDYLVLSEPWTPVGQAAQLAGVAMLLLAGAGAVLPFVLAHGTLRLQVPTALAAAAAPAIQGVHAWTSGAAGQVQPSPASAAATTVWALAVPVALLAWAVRYRASDDGPHRRRWALALAVALTASTPVPLVLLGPLVVGYASHDTAPWSDAVIALPLAVAAVLVWKVGPSATRGARTPAGDRHRRLPAST